MSHKMLPPIPIQSKFRSTPTIDRGNHGEAPPSYRASVQTPPSLDISQRLERKLAQYNASQNVWKRWLFEIISWTTSAAWCGYRYAAILSRPPLERAILRSRGLQRTVRCSLLQPSYYPLLRLLDNSSGHGSTVTSRKRCSTSRYSTRHREERGVPFSFYFTRRDARLLRSVQSTSLHIFLSTSWVGIITIRHEFPASCAKFQNDCGEVLRSIRYEPDAAQEFREGLESTMDDVDTNIVAEKFLYRNGTQILSLTRGSINGTKAKVPVVSQPFIHVYLDFLPTQ
ncbi:hypothetical protein BU25DRAFT_233914 [Macroventuria anomochaeta]|uniref:Uncharacterized protein n=1 Tax=Macroventuria anomochaeta TaxID=301207 RepID=A0ACB6RKR5_9PLEO|nr:uncharacterized protein BU25DRAFT_233914 [Macroventuria anomochaeta]KAF2621564.1 hypothetical protein BU25DRAFT_233914 [Macroventuria anomochaeta]